MTPSLLATYEHKQSAPLCWIPYLLAFGFLTLASVLQGDPIARVVLLVAGVLLLVVASSFHYLEVADHGDRLMIRFGPLPLFRRSVRYEDIEAVEPGRTMILDGWGIHLSLRGGWVWNIWGRDCVVLRLRRGMLRVGTDDTENLVRLIEQRIRTTAEG